MRGFVRPPLLAALVWILGVGTAAAESPFPRYPELEPKVAFWTDIFARYSINDSVIHPAVYPQVVLEVLHFETGTPAEVRRAQELAARERLRTALLRVQAGSRNPETLSRADKALFERFHGIKDPERFRKAADSLRSQRGIKERTARGLEVAGRYWPMMEATFRSYGLPVELTRLPIVESSFNVEAYSKAGAAGLWQFIPSSGRLYMRLDEVVDERRDPWVSTDAAARHLRDDYALLGDWALAVTAYNHGRNGIARGLRETGGRTLIDLIERYENPRFGFASKNFYAEFLAAKDIAANARRYFPDLQPESPLAFEELELAHYVPYPTLVRLAGGDEALFRLLNPAFTPAVHQGQLWVPKGYRVRVPAQRAQSFKVAYAQLPESELGTSQRVYWREHRVARGEALSRIARQYGVSVAALQQANDIRNPAAIRVGQRLRIPPAGGTVRAVAAPTAPRGQPDRAVTSARQHTVRAGQTLSGIARQYGVSVAALQQANGLSGTDIRAGQTLTIPSAGLRKVALRTHTVAAGDTLSGIARRYGVSTADLARANGLTDKHRIRPGQTLKIPE